MAREGTAAVASRLPRSVNAASSVLGGNRVGGAAGAYVRHGLDLATHRVFLGLVGVAVLALAALALTPRRFEQI